MDGCSDPKLRTIDEAARIIGVPFRWLHTEAAARRVPVVRVGRRLLCDPDMVARALLDRALADAGGGR